MHAVGEDLLFHRVTASGSPTPATSGSGDERVFTPSEVAFLGSVSGVALLDDWDF